jgi:pimeloyl-ACP methyl ester carboxylesterase
MKKLKCILIIVICAAKSFGQTGQLIENKAIKFSVELKKDLVEFIVVDTLLSKKKPIFLWCQGSLPVPLFCEIENYGNYFFGGGVSNFNYKEISAKYHLVIISMPKTPLVGKKEHLNSGFQYIPNPEEPLKFSKEYIDADYLDNYVNRAKAVLKFLKKQKWVSNEKLIVAGHSQGTKVATKMALNNKDVTHLGLFAANPFGRIDQYIREARLDAQLGKISWEKADSLTNDNYEFYKQVNNNDSILTNPSLKSWKTFSEPFYDDWLSLDIPIYLTYGSEDRTSDLCDIVPLFFIGKGKDNLTIKRYAGLEHNFFELNQNGRVDYEKGHWVEVMGEFIKWIK